MPGKVILRAYGYRVDDALGGAFEVLTRPALALLCRRFWRGNSGRPFEDAAEFASRSAAALGWSLEDETGRLCPSQCAAMVAEQAGKCGAKVVPIVVAMERRAERSGR